MASDAQRLRRVRELFDSAVELPEAQRRAWLERETDADPSLRAEVQALIDETERTSPGVASRLGDDALARLGDASALTGQRLGPYDVVRLIGMGGMGAVYEAHRADEQYQKRVAIKLVQSGLLAPPTLARFRRERQILASLQHRNIATLLDGGVSPDGRPFLVMEYVAGEPITTYADRLQLTVAQRLGLFRQVCEAVRHAHRNLVIHRDLKPGNILVTAEGDVKLLDFGVAKILSAEAEAEDAEMPLTRGGVRAFTPEYASPEQIRGEVLTTASDVYSLGVVLFELLTGRRPHTGGTSVAAIERAVLEQPAPKPSAVVTDAAARVRGERDAQALRRRLTGELDSIVLLALRPESEQRWPTAQAFSDDVKRHLEGRPVEAQRGWNGYQVAKFLRRNRAAVAGAAIVLLVLVGGVIATGIQAGRARAAQARAERVNAFLIDLLQSVRPETGGRDVPVSELLEAAGKRVATEMAGQGAVQAELESVIGYSFLSLGRYDDAAQHMMNAARLQGALHGEASGEHLLAISNLSEAYLDAGELEPADSLTQLGLKLARSRPAPEDSLLCLFLSQTGSIAHSRGDAKGAEHAHREALMLRERILGPMNPTTAHSLNNLAVALGDQGQWAASESLDRRALRIYKSRTPEDSVSVANIENSLATALDLQGKPVQAESLYLDVLARRAKFYGKEHPDYAFTLVNYSMFVFDRGRFEQCAELTRQILALRGKTLPDTHPAIAASLQTLGRCLDHLGRYDEGGKALRESYALRLKNLGPDSWLVASSQGVLGEHFTLTHDYAKAERLLLGSEAALSAKLGAQNPRTLTNVKRLVELYEAMHDPAKAAPYRARMLAPKS